MLKALGAKVKVRQCFAGEWQGLCMYKRECDNSWNRKKWEERLAGLTDSSRAGCMSSRSRSQPPAAAADQTSRPDLDSVREMLLLLQGANRGLTPHSCSYPHPIAIVLQMYRLCDGDILYIVVANLDAVRIRDIQGQVCGHQGKTKHPL